LILSVQVIRPKSPIFPKKYKYTPKRYTVLKDTTATALYGTRASKGVIIIQDKKIKKKKSKVKKQ